MTKAMFVVVLAMAGCGGGGSNGDDDDQPAVDAATTAQPLTCKSIALCTTYDVKTFLGTVPAPEGGTVKDGIYRLQYVLVPSNVNETSGYHESLEALQIRGKYFNWAGFGHESIGTITTNGSMIAFNKTQYCYYGTDGDATTATTEYKYTATGNELRIYSHVTRSDGVEWDELNVYVPASSPADVCQTVSADPTQPGDSTKCRVTNCECHFAIEGTVNDCY
jgi:hypothetical protein